MAIEPIAKLTSYINSAIPYAWDDSESWFEFLAKVLAKVNEIIEKTNDYFDVDVLGFVSNTLNTWKTDGTLETLFNVLFNEYGEKIEHIEAISNGVSFNVMNPPNGLTAPIGDGVADDSDAIQTIYNALPDGSVLTFPKGIYYLGTTLVFNKNISIIGEKNQSVFLTDSNITAIKVTGELIKTTYLSSAVEYNAKNTIPLNDASGINEEHIIVIRDYSRLWPHDQRDYVFYGETNIPVGESLTNDLVLSMPLSTNYPSGATVEVYLPVRDVVIKGLSFKRKDKSINVAAGLSMGFTRNCLISDITVDRYGAAGVTDSISVGNIYQNLHISNAWWFGTTTSYGLQVNGSIFTQVNDSHFFNNRRGIDFSGSFPSRYCSASSCTAFGTMANNDETSGFGNHGPNEYSVFNDCKVYGCKVGFLIRGSYTTLKNCSGYGINSFFISISAGTNHIIDGCINDKYMQSESGVGQVPQFPNFIAVNAPFYNNKNGLIMQGCVAKCGSRFCQITRATRDCTIIIMDCIVYGRLTTFVPFDVGVNDVATTYNIDVKNCSFRNLSNGNPIKLSANPDPLTTVVFSNSDVVSGITTTPTYVGQLAISSGNVYVSIGTTSTDDWKRINNEDAV